MNIGLIIAVCGAVLFFICLGLTLKNEKTFKKVMPGGHPTIPYGEIIAKPRADGGYSILVYHGIQIGWIHAGEVEPGHDIYVAMENLNRPVIIMNSENNQKETR